ncbi:MAG: hypothetical protein WB735_09800 [Pseudonocardiaceae bacterium]
MRALARDGAGRSRGAQVGLRRGRVGRLAGRAAPGVGLEAGVGLRSTSDVAVATGEAAMLATVQPAVSGPILLTVGDSAMGVLLAVLAGAPPADEPAGVVARALAGVLARTAARLLAAW